MYNRYVDGLATVAPDDPAVYEAMAVQIAELGYSGPTPEGLKNDDISGT
jgi:hypothetical protein